MVQFPNEALIKTCDLPLTGERWNDSIELFRHCEGFLLVWELGYCEGQDWLNYDKPLTSMGGGNLSCYFPLHYWQYISNSRRNVPQRRKFRLHKTRRSSPRARDQIIIVPNCPLNWHCKYIMRICHNSAEQQLVRTSPPENTRRWPCVGLKRGCRRRRRDQAEPIIGPTGREKPWCLVLSASSLSLSCLWKFNPLSDKLFN